MKRVMLAVLALLMFAVPAVAQKPAGAVYHKGPFIKRALIATGACGIGIGLSGNPATAAEIGLPILIGGNGLAYKLDRSGHPKWSAFVQTISPIGCWAHYGSHVKPKPALHTVKTQLPHNNPPSGGSTTPPSGGTTTPPSGGTGGSGGTSGGNGSGSGSGSGSGGSTGGSGSGGSTGGSGGSGGTGGGTGGSGGGGNGHGCIQDCGFPGNGGMNGGHDINKPPFPGKGNGGSNIGNGSGKGKN